MTFIVTEIDYS